MPKGIRSIQISVGETRLTHFGGIILIQRFCQKLRLKWHLQNQVRFTHHPKQYHPIELILAIIFALIAGIPRLTKTKKLQGNGSFQQVIGLKSFPYASSLRRFLKRANHKTIQSIINAHDYLRQKMFQFYVPKTSFLFDLDSSAITVYGKSIEGAEVGYNPGKRGKRSYHPLFCFEANSKDSWHSILRPGNTSSSTGVIEFFNVCLTKLPPYIYRIRVRADAGFYNLKLIELLEEKNIGYVIVARITGPIKLKLGGLRYHRFRKDWAAAEFHYVPHNWKKPRRFIVIRRPLPEKDSDQLTLFTMKRYSYQVFITNLPLKPGNVWYFYRRRALIEKYIRELKENFALAKIPTNNFLANQFYFHLLLLAYDIVNWFKMICLPPRFRNATLETIRTEFLVIPGRLVRTGNRNTLKLPSEYIPQHILGNIMQKIENMKSL